MIDSVKKMYSRKPPAMKSSRASPSGDKINKTDDTAEKNEIAKTFKKPIPAGVFPKPEGPKKLKLVFENRDGDPTLVIGNRAYPGEAARSAALSERERNLFRSEIEYEEIRRRALETEKIAAERERTLRELEALLAARESLLEAREKRAAENPALPLDANPALDQMKQALDQREERLREAQVSLAEREEQLREREKKLSDADALLRLKAEVERREKELEEAQNALREREEFLETSENLICEKGQMLVEREAQLDQREEELELKAKELGGSDSADS